MNDQKDLEELKIRIYGGLMEARHKKTNLLGVLDEVMDNIDDDFTIVFYGVYTRDKIGE